MCDTIAIANTRACFVIMLDQNQINFRRIPDVTCTCSYNNNIIDLEKGGWLGKLRERE